MKKTTEIKNERAYYYVNTKDGITFESESITECKKYLCNYIKAHKKEIEKENELWEYYIGMYAICIMD